MKASPMDDRVRHILDEYLNRPPAQTVEEAKIRAYQDWTVSQLLIRILDKPWTYAGDMVYEFALEMAQYLEMFDPNSVFYERFYICYKTAEDIFLMIEGPRED